MSSIMETKTTDEPAKVPRTLGKFLVFLLTRIVEERKWWMLPIWVLAVIVGLVLYLSGGGAMLPAIYLAF
jgi:hypothetical protein